VGIDFCNELLSVKAKEKISIAGMRRRQFLSISSSKVKSRFVNQVKTYRKLQKTKRKVAALIRLHLLLIEDLEYEIILICRDSLRYFLMVIIWFCLFST